MERKQCENCPFKDGYLNMIMQDDIIEIEKENEIKEYCSLFPKGIPNEYLDNKEICLLKVMQDTKK